MNPVTLNLTDELQQFVTTEAVAGNYATSAGYIEALIARAKAGKARLDQMLIEGLESGEPIPLDKDEFARIRSDVKRRLSHG